MHVRRIAGWIPVVTLGIALLAGTPTLTDRYGRPPTGAADGADRVTVLAAGDILVHPPTWRQAAADARPGVRYDFRPILNGIRTNVSAADIALCHMEAPMGDGAPQDFRRFKAPTELAAAIRQAGFDGCSTASNHSLDQGPAGVASTLSALDGAGLKHAGTARTPAEQARPVLYRAGPVTVGHLSATYGLNRGTTLPAGASWMVNILDTAHIVTDARRLRQAGADIVVLSAHWGTERVHEVSDRQRQAARQLAASGEIDLVVGHHAHVVQPAERVGRMWVFYGVGNLLARHDFPTDDNRAGILPRVTFARDRAGRWQAVRVEVVPVWLVLEPRLRLLVLPDTIGRLSDADRRRWKYERVWQATAGQVDGLGARRDGLTVVGW